MSSDRRAMACAIGAPPAGRLPRCLPGAILRPSAVGRSDDEQLKRLADPTRFERATFAFGVRTDGCTARLFNGLDRTNRRMIGSPVISVLT
jgi:hypothetical protein